MAAILADATTPITDENGRAVTDGVGYLLVVRVLEWREPSTLAWREPQPVRS